MRLGVYSAGMKPDVRNKRVAVVGLGFVGLPLGATLADLGFAVTGVEKNPAVLATLRQGKSHFEEQGLQMYLDRHLGGRLRVDDALRPGEHDVYIIAVGTPVDSQTRIPVLDHVEEAARMVGACLKKGDLVVMRSTVPVGTTRECVLPLLQQASGMEPDVDFQLVFAPERLVAGRAMEELRELPQIIGGLSEDADLTLPTRLFKTMTPIVVEVDSLEAAEMAKIIDNSYRDLTFAYANQMALLCEAIGINMVKLSQAVNFGYKRNHVPAPSPGVGGTCLTKDPFILLQVGKKYGYEPRLAKTAREINESMPPHVAQKTLSLLRKAGKTPEKSTVLILGMAFKGRPETSDTRDSPSIPVAQELQRAGCTVIAYDPVVSDEKVQALGITPVGLEQGFAQADAAIVMTNHRVFSTMDIYRLLPTMRMPAAFVDGWHLFDPRDIKAIDNIHYGGIGND